jgi:hypothetical protein
MFDMHGHPICQAACINACEGYRMFGDASRMVLFCCINVVTYNTITGLDLTVNSWSWNVDITVFLVAMTMARAGQVSRGYHCQ